MKALFLISRKTDLSKDKSTRLLIDEAQRQFHQVDICNIEKVSMVNGTVCVGREPISQYDLGFIRANQDQFTPKQLKMLSRSLIRFDNEPSQILQFSSKIYPLKYQYSPITIVSDDFLEIIKFIEENPSIDSWVMKPTDSFRGRNIRFIQSNINTRDLQIEMSHYDGPVVVQEKLPVEKKGDKRVLVANYGIIGAGLRFPPDGSTVANHHRGGYYEKTEISDKEYEIVKEISTSLSYRDLLFLGIDLIDENVTEINVGSVGSISSINNLVDYNVPKKIIDELRVTIKR